MDDEQPSQKSVPSKNRPTARRRKQRPFRRCVASSWFKKHGKVAWEDLASHRGKIGLGNGPELGTHRF